MGSGASNLTFAPVSNPSDVQNKLKKLMANKQNMDKLFKKIASLGKQGGRADNIKEISQSELLQYFLVMEKSKKDPALRNFTTKSEVLSAAFRHVVGKGSKGATGITRKKFRILLPTIFLFSELWEVFEVVDSGIDDKKIFKGEFNRAYQYFQNMNNPNPNIKKERRLSGVRMENISSDLWEKEFDVIDKDKSGFITFDEFCSYAIKNIIDPMDFMDKEAVEEAEGEGGEGGEEGELDRQEVIISDNGDIVTRRLSLSLSPTSLSSPPALSISAGEAILPTNETSVTASDSLPLTLATATATGDGQTLTANEASLNTTSVAHVSVATTITTSLPSNTESTSVVTADEQGKTNENLASNS